MLYQVLVRLEDERGTRDANVLINEKTLDEATEQALEFARNNIFFGAKREYVDWLQTSAVELPFVMRVDALIKIKRKKKRSQANRAGVK